MAAVIALAAMPVVASAAQGWSQVPIASEGYGAWLDRAGLGAVAILGYDAETDEPTSWTEQALLPDGGLGAPRPGGPPLATSTDAVRSGPRMIIATPTGLMGEDERGRVMLGRAPFVRVFSATSNERGDVLVAGAPAGSRRSGLALWADGSWHVAPRIPGNSTPAAALGAEGTAIVASALAHGIATFERLPAGGWRRLPDIPTKAPVRLGVAVDGSGVATLVYSLNSGGARAVTLMPGDSHWSDPVRAGSGLVWSVATDLSGHVWLLTVPASGLQRVTMLSRPPGGSWRRQESFPGLAPELVVGPFGDVFVSSVDASPAYGWTVRRRDVATGTWSVTPSRYIAADGVVNRAGDAVSAHIHPIEQGNFPQAFLDRFVAPARPSLLLLHAPTRIVRGRPATVRVRLSGQGPIVVRVRSNSRQIVAASLADSSGRASVVLPARLTRLLPTGAARLVADSGGHDVASSLKRAVLLVRPTA